MARNGKFLVFLTISGKKFLDKPDGEGNVQNCVFALLRPPKYYHNGLWRQSLILEEDVVTQVIVFYPP